MSLIWSLDADIVVTGVEVSHLVAAFLDSRGEMSTAQFADYISVRTRRLVGQFIKHYSRALNERRVRPEHLVMIEQRETPPTADLPLVTTARFQVDGDGLLVSVQADFAGYQDEPLVWCCWRINAAVLAVPVSVAVAP